MNNILKHPYEISLWEDVYEKKGRLDNNTLKYDSNFSEKKIAVIGAHDMNSWSRAVNPQLQQNLNGTSTLTFSMYYQYYDSEKKEFVRNPFVDLIFSERKIKLKYEDGSEDPWHDFIIKEIQEDSESYRYIYTATDLFINELSKNGFKVEFNTELENNNGTNTQLVRTILEETDWKIVPTKEEISKNGFEEWCDYNGDYSDLLRQTKIEPLYPVTLNKQITAKLCDTKDRIFNGRGFKEEITIEANETIYLFHNAVESLATTSNLLQFIYLNNSKYEVDDSKVIINAPNYQITKINGNIVTKENISWDEEKGVPTGITNLKLLQISDLYRGERLVWNFVTGTDLVLNEHYTKYLKNGIEYNGYTKSEYVVSGMVQNYVTNGQDFNNLNGWRVVDGSSIEGGITPNPKDYTSSGTMMKDIVSFTSYLKMNGTVYNSGFRDAADNIETIGAGEKYVLKAIFGTNAENGEIIEDFNSSISIRMNKINEEGYESLNNPYFEVDNIKSGEIRIFSFSKGVNKVDLKSLIEPIEIILETQSIDPNNTNRKEIIFLKSLEIFKYIPVSEEDSTPILPGDIPTSKVKTKYYIYNPKDNKGSKEPESYTYSYIGYEPILEGFIPLYDSTFEKIRSITGAESNRFNMIQDVCETFECWAKFIINHNLDGSIKYQKNEFGKRIYEKYVLLKKFIGQNNNRGFRYGINLKNIQRNVSSDQIVTKLIVKNNKNEYGKNGFCTISRATNNYSGDNTIYDFSYYVNAGLLNANEVNNDLYAYVITKSDPEGKKIDLYENPQGYLAFLTKYNKINKNLEPLLTVKNSISTSIIFLESQVQVLGAERIKNNEYLTQAKSDFKNYFGKDFDSCTDTELMPRITIDKKLEELYTNIITYKAIYEKFEEFFSNAEEELLNSKAAFENCEQQEKQIEEYKIELNKEFYKKYSRFIQEGSWISEDYYDDDWYYFDALEVLYNSSQPQISYTINVMDLSSLDEYSNYNFKIGDKTYIEDTEFFGYSDYITKTPLRKDVVVSEVIWNLDNPVENQIKIQNYKTQFDELFQRITATTQSLQYASGSYGRAANAINSNNTINSQILQNSFTNNSILISNSKDQSVVWDETGISITNLRNPNQIVRLVSGGIVLSTDGGSTWKTGISASGINTQYLTSGQIDVSKINIIGADGLSGFPAFRWDALGLSAYYWLENGGYDFNRFVRFDRFGIYGVKGKEITNFDSGLKSAIEEGNIESVKQENGINYIKENSKFGLTWDGFFLKSDEYDGYIEISNTDDIVVKGLKYKEPSEEKPIKEYINRIKIGRIDEEKNIYGILIKDELDNSVLESTSEGKLWLSNKMIIGPKKYDPRVIFGIVDTYTVDNEDPIKNEGPFFSYTEYTDIDGNTHIIEDHPLFNFEPKPNKDYSKILSINYSYTDENNNEIEEETIALFDSGHLYAKNAYIEGHIEATSGNIGGATILPDKMIIKNGGLEIINTKIPEEDDQRLLWFDSENGNLYIKGNGEFTGTIKATDGEFTGTINATSGEFSGRVEISETGVIESSNFNEENNTGFQINGNGTIIANEIKLGTGATIEKYLKFKSDSNRYTSWFFNPEYSKDYIGESNKNTFILLEDGETTKEIVDGNEIINYGKELLKFTTDGIFKIGGDSGIIIDGVNRKIMTSFINNDDGYFSITPNLATFKKINVEQMLVGESVFQSSTIQSLGGIFIVRPTAIIEKLVDNLDKSFTITLDNIEGFGEGDYCFIQEDNEQRIFTIKQIIDATKQIITEDLNNVNFKEINTANVQNYINKAVINIKGKEDNSTNIVKRNTSIGIGINSSSASSLLPPTSISVFNTNIKTDEIGKNKIELEPRIVLGYFSEELFGSNNFLNDYQSFINGSYGLYADNVLVKGSIIADGIITDEINGNKGYSAGLSSSSKINLKDLDIKILQKYFGKVKELWNYDGNGNISNLKDDAEIGEILIWAGANGRNKDDILNSNFIVDCYGNIIANRGYFKGTLITDSTIQSSFLSSAEIVGENNSNLPENERGFSLIFKEGDITNSDIGGFSFKCNINNELKDILEITHDSVSINEVPLDLNYLYIHKPDYNDNKQGTELNPRAIIINDKEISFIKNEELTGDIFAKKESWDNLTSIYYSDNENNGLIIGEKSFIDNKWFSFGEKKENRINKSYLDIKFEEDFFAGTYKKIDSNGNEEENNIMHYQKTNNGYDLFIMEE